MTLIIQNNCKITNNLSDSVQMPIINFQRAIL